jgi:transcriptional regulator with XRE-family HTH domain
LAKDGSSEDEYFFDDKSFLKCLGVAIRKLRVERRMTQKELGDLCGLTRTYVCILERAPHNLSFGNLLRVATALKVPASFLLRAAEDLHAQSLVATPE